MSCGLDRPLYEVPIRAGPADRTVGACRKPRSAVPAADTVEQNRQKGLLVRAHPALSRTVGLAVLGASAVTSALVCLAAVALHPKPLQAPDESVLFGFWRVLYNIQ